MNLLQKEPFAINGEVLSFIKDNRDLLVEMGLTPSQRRKNPSRRPVARRKNPSFSLGPWL